MNSVERFTAPAASDLVSLLRQRAEERGGDLLYRFLADGERDESTLSYAELDRKSRAIGAYLQGEGLQGKRAVLLYPPSLDYTCGFFACLVSGVVAVPAYPPDLNRLERTLPRLLAIVRDCEAAAVLTTEPIRAIAEFLFTKAPELKKLKWISTDLLALQDQISGNPVKPDPDALAFLQYSSGSTGDPKGVMLSHGNLMHNLGLISQAFSVTATTVGVIWLPPYHDMGLIGGILQPLYAGIEVTLMSPLDFLKKPLRWLQAISRYGGTHSGGPNFAFDLCVRKARPEDIRELDLSHWELAFCGAEPVHQETLEQFEKTFSTCGFRREAFYPCYGLAEGTLIVSGGIKGLPPVYAFMDKAALQAGQVVFGPTGPATKPFVGCGSSFSGQEIAIADPESSRRLSEGKIGEIWVQGASIALGYWNKPSETQEAFGARLADTGEGPFLRTGDLGFLRDGELFFTGRLKDLLIIRGKNHYPQDIELTVEKSHPFLRPGCVAAFSVEQGLEERLVVVQEVELALESPSFSLEAENIIQAIRKAVSEDHEIQVFAISLIKRGSIAKTSSGKIRRRACREEFLSGSLEPLYSYRHTMIGEESPPADRNATEDGHPPEKEPFKASSSKIQAWLINKLSTRLGLNPREIDIRQPLAQYGLDSKDAVSLSGDLEEFTGRPFPLTLLWKYPTVEQLTEFLASPDNP